MRKIINSSDIHLVEKVKNGDTSAFQQLVDKYKDVSFSLACSILKDEHIAEDALQESFLKVYKNIREFRNQSSFPTWLYRIVVNNCFNLARKYDTPRQADPRLRNASMEQTDVGSGYEQFRMVERKAIINQALYKMKPDESLLLRLFYLSGLGIKEIKKVTGYSESKIKVTLHRARKNLHDQLEHVLGNEIKTLI